MNYSTATIYEISINACNKYQYANDPLRSTKAIQFYKSCIKSQLSDICQYYFTFEISEPKYGVDGKPITRIHLHGVIKFNDIESILKFHETRFNNLISTCSVQMNMYRKDYWPWYIHKQSHMMKSYPRLVNSKQLKNIIYVDKKDSNCPDELRMYYTHKLVKTTEQQQIDIS